MTTAAISREEFSPLVKSIVVPWTPEAAFRRWTTDIATWWPVTTHSVGQKKVKTLVFDSGVGGRCYEVWYDGTEKEWGRVTSWDPPHLVRYTWYPDRTPESAQEIEVRFEREGSGTRLTLTHTGWERLGDQARKARRGYPIGWEYVMQVFAGRKGLLVYALDVVGMVLRLVQR
jgi:uncharacterized protein YndB with AHSA1/START domain